ncbi:MAG TPA: vWA domain-containing protein [Spirochaetota bacterium]|nr:vWA domain-containing protein [Spirochaetota bacterium]
MFRNLSIVFLLLILQVSLFSEEDFAELIKMENSVRIYRNNSQLKIGDDTILYKDDIIDATQGTILLKYIDDNRYGYFSRQTKKVSDPLRKYEIKEEYIDKLLSNKINIDGALRNSSIITNPNMRTSNVNLILVLDVSGSMNKYFYEVQKYINDTIFNNILIDGDHLSFFTFGTYVDKKIDKKLRLPDDYSLLSNAIFSSYPNHNYTDIGLALENIDNKVNESTLPCDKTIIFFITDGLNIPSPQSKYYGVDIYAKGAFKSYETIKSGNFKVMLLSIGEKTAAKDLTDPLGGEYIEVSIDLSSEMLNRIIADFLATVEMIAPKQVELRKGQKFNLNIAFLSNYSTLKEINIENIDIKIETLETKINKYLTNFKIEPYNQSIQSYNILLPKNIKEGEYKVDIDFLIKDNAVSKTKQSSFLIIKAGLNFLFLTILIIILIILIIIVLVILHKKYIIDIPIFEFIPFLGR